MLVLGYIHLGQGTLYDTLTKSKSVAKQLSLTITLFGLQTEKYSNTPP